MATVIATAIGLRWWPAIPQDPRYHQMADQRTLLGIPNALNVISNLPFALVGGFGLVTICRRGRDTGHSGEEPWLRWPYGTVFVGALLTAVGSSYYHLAPDNGRLVWDRLPMTLAFMGLLTAIVGERVSTGLSRVLFGPLLAMGAASVFYWYWTEAQGRGDLRPYALVQFGSLLVIALLLLLYPAGGDDGRYLTAGFAGYAVAKVLELWDRPVFMRTGFVSGHTLKHLAAAAAVGCVAAMVHLARETGGPVVTAGHPSRDG